MPLVATLSTLVIVVVLAGCGWSRQGYESAPYRVVERDGEFELRDYPGLVVVETQMGRDGGGSFQRLFGYISGGNLDSEKIAMTTPVLMSGEGSDRSMAFVMPSAMEAVPEPEDPGIRVVNVPAGRFAVLGFPGSRSIDAEQLALGRLRSWLASRALESTGDPVYGYFDPPWTPGFMRRNEVMLRLDGVAR